jgi:hypothetical protein
MSWRTSRTARETANRGIADKTARIAWYQKLIEDLDGYLADPDLDLRLRSRYTREVASMLKAVAEEKGELPTRSTIELESGPTLFHSVEGDELKRRQAQRMQSDVKIRPAPRSRTRGRPR